MTIYNIDDICFLLRRLGVVGFNTAIDVWIEVKMGRTS